MAQPTIQTSFASGEWAPKLRSRVDIQKYRAGAALLRNFYVDYAGGGASTRPGTQYINCGFNSNFSIRLIPFQPSANLSFVLEFGHGYIRFYSNGAPILESPFAVTGIAGNTVTAAGNNYVAGDWVIMGGAVLIVSSVAGPNFNVTDLFSNIVTPTGATVQRIYTIPSPFAGSDLFPNPITGNPGIKFVQNVTSMIITHPSYPVQVLTINSAANWTIAPANFGTTTATPTISSLTTTLAALASSWSYAYTVTAVDASGQESTAPTPSTLLNYKSLSDSTAPGTNILIWAAVPGASSYNIYKASPIFNTTFPVNVPVGFIANTSATSFTDTTPGIAPDFSQTPPISQNPFQGAGVTSYTVTATGTYTSVPTVTVGAPPTGGSQATAQASLGVTVATINAHGTSDVSVPTGNPSPVNSFLSFANGVVLKITSVTFLGSTPSFDRYQVNSTAIQSAGSIVAGSTPTNPVAPTGCSATGSVLNIGFNFNFTWGVTQVTPTQQGAGYLSPPTVTFSAGAAAATANLGSFAGGGSSFLSAGNPGVCGFIQQRLVLASQQKAVQSINMSQPDNFFNFNYSFPVEADDAISTQIISAELNDIRSLTQVPSGLLAFTGRAAWLINGGSGISTQDPITPANITAQPQGFNGANDLQPIKINFDILYGTKKGNYVRDLTYNLYAQIFTGTDISVLSSHLFFNYWLAQWAWAEEPFKTAWIVRNDGILLSLAYVKDQELQGFAHHDTNGRFQSVCSVLETVNGSSVDAVYVVVERQVNSQQLKYVERLNGRKLLYGAEDAWAVDAALQTAPINSFPNDPFTQGDISSVGNLITIFDSVNSPFTGGMVGWVVRASGGVFTITAFTSSSQVTAQVNRVPTSYNVYDNQSWGDGKGYTIWQPVTSIGGLNHLVGQTVTGLADGVVVPSTVVSAPGNVTLSTPATKVTLGLPFTPQLQTLALDLGEPTVQSKRKKLPAATMRVADTLGLQIGTTFANAVAFKDFQLGAIPSVSNGPSQVNDLYSGDGRQILDQVWQEIGQLCVQQNLPYPATVLGVMPEVVVGDTPEGGGGGRRR